MSRAESAEGGRVSPSNLLRNQLPSAVPFERIERVDMIPIIYDGGECSGALECMGVDDLRALLSRCRGMQAGCNVMLFAQEMAEMTKTERSLLTAEEMALLVLFA